MVGLVTKNRPYLLRVLIALDRFGNAVTGGRDDETWSQSLGFDHFRGVKRTAVFMRIVDWLNRLATGEENHCIRSLYRDDLHPIWPDRMPKGAPMLNPYPDPRPKTVETPQFQS